MSYIKKSLAQTGANATTELAIPTLLTVDGKAGWSILGMDIYVSGLGAAVNAVADGQCLIELNTEATPQSYDDPDNIIFHQFQFSGITASTTALQVFGGEQVRLILPRLTVQPTLYLNISSSGLLTAVTANIQIVYEIVKLSDIEVMRLMQGGA